MEIKPVDGTMFVDEASFKPVETELRARVRQQAAVANLGQWALMETNPSTLMDETVNLVAQILDVEYCKILELLPGGQELLLRAGVGWRKGYVGQVTVPAQANSQAGYTLLLNKPVIVEDLRTETRFSGPLLLREHHVVSGISVIIYGQAQPFGVLGAHTSRRRTFTTHDIHFLQSVANVLAAAIERKRVEEALRLSRDQLEIILQGAADGITAQDPLGRLIYANAAAARIIGYPSVDALLATPLPEILDKFEILDEAGQPFPLAHFPGRLALQGQPAPSAIVRFRVKATGEERWSDVKARPVFNEKGKVELAVNIFQDITELKRAEQAQRILAEAGSLLAASTDYATRLANVARLAVPHLADWCAVYVINEDESVRQVAVAHVDPAKVALAHELQRRYPPNWNATSSVANVLRTGQSEFYPHITQAMLEAVARDPEHLRLIRNLKMKSAMVVPLIARGRTLGAMIFVWAESGRHYDRADLGLAEELARRAALAVDNARLYRQAQKLNSRLEERVKERTAELQATNAKLKEKIAEHQQTQAELAEMQRRLMESREAERLRLAQDLHDGPVQDLYGVSYSLGGLKEMLTDETGLVQLARAQATLQQVIQMLRTTSGELRPPTLAAFGLEKAIRSHAERFQAAHPELELELALMPDHQALPERVRLALFRIYQEALNNVVRHANALRVSIRFSLDTEQIILEVRDDGCGFEVPQRWIRLARQGHLGLVGMSERAEAIGGKLEVTSTPAAGTTIRAVIARTGEQEAAA